MKNSVLIALTLGTALIIGATGCKHGPVGNTPIPGMTRIGHGGGGNDLNGGTPLPTGPEVTTQTAPITTEGVGFPTNSPYERGINGPHDKNREIFAKDTVYFDTDSSVIKSSEQSKLEDIAKYLKDNANDVLKIEGYCDERGTEGYNLALGDRRALAVREYLVNLGVDAGRIGNVSFGEANPVNSGHNETAWKQNRRGVSVLITPKAQ